MDLFYSEIVPQTITQDTQVIFYIHGYGSNEQDLLALTPDLPQDLLHISFRGRFPVERSQGYAWYDIDFNSAQGYFHKEQARDSLNALLSAFLDIQKKYGIRDGHMNLCGFSQGGVLAYALAFKNPHLFSKVACLSTYPEDQLISDISIDKKKLSMLRFFISHGTDDAIIPLEWGKKAADLLYDLGGYFTFREYMYGHGINQKNYLDLIQFFKS